MDKQYRLDNIKVDLSELRDYYNIIKTQFWEKRWCARKDYIRPESINVPDINYTAYGWGIQTFLDNDHDPCPPWNVVTKNPQTPRNTEMVFGIAQRILEKIPSSNRLGLSVTQGGHHIGSHVDGDWKFHIPIYSPPKSFWTWDNEQGEHLSWEHLEEGVCYIMDARLKHSVINQDTTDRVHILCNITDEAAEYLLNSKIEI